MKTYGSCRVWSSDPFNKRVVSGSLVATGRKRVDPMTRFASPTNAFLLKLVSKVSYEESKEKAQEKAFWILSE